MGSPGPNGRLALGSCLETNEDRSHETAAESTEFDKPGVATPDKLGVHRAGVPAAEDAAALPVEEEDVGRD